MWIISDAEILIGVGVVGHEGAEPLPRITTDLIVIDTRGTNKVVAKSVGPEVVSRDLFKPSSASP